MIDFCFVFPERSQALAFAGLANEKEIEVSVSYYSARDSWQAVVRCRMIPTHQAIGGMESSLTVRAQSVGGKADGWGCLLVHEKTR